MGRNKKGKRGSLNGGGETRSGGIRGKARDSFKPQTVPKKKKRGGGGKGGEENRSWESIGGFRGTDAGRGHFWQNVDKHQGCKTPSNHREGVPGWKRKVYPKIVPENNHNTQCSRGRGKWGECIGKEDEEPRSSCCGENKSQKKLKPAPKEKISLPPKNRGRKKV